MGEDRRPVVVDLAGVDTAGADGVAWALPDGGDLNANLVTLGAGGRIGLHRNAEVDVAMVVVSGAGELVVDGQKHSLRPHMLAHIPKATERQVDAGPTGLVYLSLHRSRPGLRITTRPSA